MMVNFASKSCRSFAKWLFTDPRILVLVLDILYTLLPLAPQRTKHLKLTSSLALDTTPTSNFAPVAFSSQTNEKRSYARRLTTKSGFHCPFSLAFAQELLLSWHNQALKSDLSGKESLQFANNSKRQKVNRMDAQTIKFGQLHCEAQGDVWIKSAIQACHTSWAKELNLFGILLHRNCLNISKIPSVVPKV